MRIYLTIFLTTLSTILLPLPEEAALLGAGYMARVGRGGLLGCALAAGLAVLLGDIASYCVGRFLLWRLLRTRLGERMIPEARRTWAETLVQVYGPRAILIARFLVGLRGFVYFSIGASRYPFARFVAIDAAAATVSVTALTTIGFEFGILHARVGRGFDLAAAGILLVLLFGPLIARRMRRA